MGHRFAGDELTTTNYINYPHAHVGMATKNISITEGAYTRLARLRKGKESFSEIITRLTQKRQLLELAGVLSEEAARDLEATILKQRERAQREHAKRLKTIVKELSK